MHLVVGIGLALIQSLSLYCVVKGAGALLRKDWRSGSLVLLGVAVLALYVVALGIGAYLLRPRYLEGTTIDPSHKARILAENISGLMNISAWGMPVGLLAGAAIAVRDWRLHPPAAVRGSPRDTDTSKTNPTEADARISRGQALTLGCLVGVDWFTKVVAVHFLTGNVELNSKAPLQLLLRVNESGLGTWARAFSGSSSAAQRAAASVAWLTVTIYLVATRRTGWAHRLRVLVGCTILAGAFTCASLARAAFDVVPHSILVPTERVGPAAFLTYLWSIAPPGLWRATAKLFAAAALGNLVGFFAHPEGVVDFIYSRFLATIFRQGVSNVADLYFDSALVCLVVACVRAIAFRFRQMTAT